MRIFLRYLFIALLGGFGYCLIEIIWRGRTHYSMFFAGAVVLSTFYYINEMYNISFVEKCLIGMLIITGLEFVIGVLFNIVLKENVWDYSKMPLNILGQICVPFSALWFALSGVVFKVLEIIKI
jgi:uncharacterized membrane protein